MKQLNFFSPVLLDFSKKGKYLLAASFFVCLFFALPAGATESKNAGIGKGEQIPARFPGGEIAWNKYLDRNLDKTIPLKNGAPPGTYTVTVSFIVNKTGAISEISAETNPGYGTKEEALKLISKGPKWVPAELDGQKVVYRHKQKIIFVVA